MPNILLFLLMLSLSSFSVARPYWSLELADEEMAHAGAL